MQSRCPPRPLGLQILRQNTIVGCEGQPNGPRSDLVLMCTACAKGFIPIGMCFYLTASSRITPYKGLGSCGELLKYGSDVLVSPEIQHILTPLSYFSKYRGTVSVLVTNVYVSAVRSRSRAHLPGCFLHCGLSPTPAWSTCRPLEISVVLCPRGY